MKSKSVKCIGCPKGVSSDLVPVRRRDSQALVFAAVLAVPAPDVTPAAFTWRTVRTGDGSLNADLLRDVLEFGSGGRILLDRAVFGFTPIWAGVRRHGG